MLSGDTSRAVGTLLFERCDGDAFFFADGLTAFESHCPFVWVKVRGVEVHIREYSREYDRQSDIDELDIFHARLDG
jgi:hypothetical protein